MAERFDLEAIEADDALLDLLAAGGETAWAAAEHDPALMLLAELRLAVEVEDELPVETIDDPESFLARCAQLHPVNDQFARKMAARGLALGVAAVAALSISGVAAAVNGDPLSPYEKVIEKVVNGLSPTTTVPKEKLDGMPVFDKTKIVKAQKDFQKKQEEQQANAREKDDPTTALPAIVQTMITPSVVRPPQVEKPTTTKVDPPVVVPTEPSDPGGQTTTDPTDPPTDQPTEPTTTTTPPPTDPTPDPTTPTTPDPSTDPTGEPSKGDGATGESPVETTPAPSTTPSVDPTGAASVGGDTGAGETSPGDTDVSTPAGDLPAGDLPAGDVIGGVTLGEVLPTPSGEATEVPRLAQYFGDSSQAPHAKHSNGKVSLGWAKNKYQAGKHSTGKYSEGKHAAFTRAHGSMAPMTLRQILFVLNGPMNGR